MDLDERVYIAILSKYYAKMLTVRQNSILTMYIDSNLSLQEISEELNISRQGVKDSIDNAIATLKTIEEKLGFIARDNKIKNIIENKPTSQIDITTRLELIALLEE